MSGQTASVVVCVYTMDRWDDIVTGLDALGRQTVIPAEVIIVVDHNDDLLVRCKQLTASRFELHVSPSQGPPGLSGARNTGVGLARHEIIAFLDDDAEPEPPWLEKLLSPFHDPTVMVTGGRAVPYWPVSRPSWFPEEFDWVVGCSYLGMPTVEVEVRNVIGAAMAVRAEAFAVAGNFADGIGRTSTLPLGCEETELCIRICSTLPTAKVIYAPDAVVNHRVSRDRLRKQYFFRRCVAEGISKDQISRLVGNQAATSTERTYVTRTLPTGMLRDFILGVRGEPGAICRAGMIIAGLAVTTFGFFRSKVVRAFLDVPF